MDAKRAIKVLQSELKHCRVHLRYDDKAEIYYEELDELARALELAIVALKEQGVEEQ